MASIVSAGTTSATALNMSADTSGVLQLASNNGTVALTVNTSQNVGIGTSSPTAKLEVYDATTAVARVTAGTEIFEIRNTGSEVRLAVVSADPMTFRTSNVEAMRIDSNGNVGVGVTDAGYRFEVASSDTVAGFGYAIRIRANATAQAGAIQFTDNPVTTETGYIRVTNAGLMSFSNKAYIDSSGNVGIGSSTVLGKFQVNTGNIAPSTSGNMNGVVISNGNAGTGLSLGSNDSGGYNWISTGYANNANVGLPLRIIPGSQGVQLAANGTSWTSLSDERYKTDLSPIENAATKVASLRSVTGRFLSDEEGTSRSFLLAQDVLAVFPEAVDATEPERLGLQYTDVIPLLVAAINELNAKVTALENK